MPTDFGKSQNVRADSDKTVILAVMAAYQGTYADTGTVRASRGAKRHRLWWQHWRP
jgi:hypothetical protein